MILDLCAVVAVVVSLAGSRVLLVSPRSRMGVRREQGDRR